LPFKIPVAHIHGGEITQGAIDDSLRHSMTKLSHLHFVATEVYAQRVVQLGEEPWRVTISGAPGIDNLYSIQLRTSQELEKKYQVNLQAPPLLVTFHPVTLEYEQTGYYITELLAALAQFEKPVIFTLPNADTGGRVIRQKIQEYIRERSSAYILENLDTEDYFSLMSFASAMVGNSSSGIIEAPSLKLPVVNIGSRQAGRVRGKNVIDVGYSQSDIITGIRKALGSDFRNHISSMENPYGTGNASEKIASRLKSVPLDQRLIMKRFFDLEGHYVFSG